MRLGLFIFLLLLPIVLIEADSSGSGSNEKNSNNKKSSSKNSKKNKNSDSSDSSSDSSSSSSSESDDSDDSSSEEGDVNHEDLRPFAFAEFVAYYNEGEGVHALVASNLLKKRLRQRGFINDKNRRGRIVAAEDFERLRSRCPKLVPLKVINKKSFWKVHVGFSNKGYTEGFVVKRQGECGADVPVYLYKSHYTKDHYYTTSRKTTSRNLWYNNEHPKKAKFYIWRR